MTDEPLSKLEREGVEYLINELLLAVADRDEDAMVAIRSIFVTVAEGLGCSDQMIQEIYYRVPEWITVGKMRTQARTALSKVATEDQAA